MAIRIEDEYPDRAIPADTDYPHGSFKNRVSVSDRGTPLEKSWANDILGFLQALLETAGITPSGVADTAVASDYLDSLLGLFGGMRTKVIEIGDWNMDVSAAVTIASGLPDHSKIRAITAFVYADGGSNLFDLMSSNGTGTGQSYILVNDSEYIQLSRLTGGQFDSAAYSQTAGFNRGFVTIHYVD